jgi:hypothetical protein
LPSAYDRGKAALDELVAWADAHAFDLNRNEATTRLHLIDRLLGEVLGWAREHIRAEEPAGTGRIDYALGNPGTELIVEAKREGISFDLPSGTRTGVHAIEHLVSGDSGKALREVCCEQRRGTSRGGQWPSIGGLPRGQDRWRAPAEGQSLGVPRPCGDA